MKRQYTFLFAQGETQVVYPMPFSFSHQAQADVCKEPSQATVLSISISMWKEHAKVHRRI